MTPQEKLLRDIQLLRKKILKLEKEIVAKRKSKRRDKLLLQVMDLKAKFTQL